MNVKQFKRRWLNSKIEPELFYMPVNKKEIKSSKLIIRVDIYSVLNNTLNGFYDTPIQTPINQLKSFIDFVILNSLGDVIYHFSKDYISGNLELEIADGNYIVKFLYLKGYNFLNDENQSITVKNETTFVIKLYARHFKVSSVIGSDYDMYSGTRTSYYGVNTMGTVSDVKSLSQIDVFELRWNKWVKIMNYDCVPSGCPNFITQEYRMPLEPYYQGYKIEEDIYFKGFPSSQHITYYNDSGAVTSEHTTIYKGFTDEKNVVYEDNTRYDNNVSSLLIGSKTSTSDRVQGVPYYSSENLTIVGSAANLYYDKKNYSDFSDIDSDYFNKYCGTISVHYLAYGSNVEYGICKTKQAFDKVPDDVSFVKMYLPVVNYFEEGFEKEREKEAQHTGIFLKNIIGTNNSPNVNVNNNGTNEEYKRGIMFFDGFSVTIITTVKGFDSLTWYSDDYDEYLSN